jgi:hypothetical protein
MSSDTANAKKAIKKQVKRLVRIYGADETLECVTSLAENGTATASAAPAAVKAKPVKASKGDATPAKSRKAKTAAATA